MRLISAVFAVLFGCVPLIAQEPPARDPLPADLELALTADKAPDLSAHDPVTLRSFIAALYDRIARLEAELAEARSSAATPDVTMISDAAGATDDEETGAGGEVTWTVKIAANAPPNTKELAAQLAADRKRLTEVDKQLAEARRIVASREQDYKFSDKGKMIGTQGRKDLADEYAAVKKLESEKRGAEAKVNRLAEQIRRADNERLVQASRDGQPCLLIGRGVYAQTAAGLKVGEIYTVTGRPNGAGDKLTLKAAAPAQ